MFSFYSWQCNLFNFEGYSYYFIHKCELIIDTEHLSESGMRKTHAADGAWPWASAPDMLNVCASILRYVFGMNRGDPVTSCQGNCTASDCR